MVTVVLKLSIYEFLPSLPSPPVSSPRAELNYQRREIIDTQRFQNGCNEVVVELHVAHFGLKSYLRFQIKPEMRVHSSLKSFIGF